MGIKPNAADAHCKNKIFCYKLTLYLSLALGIKPNAADAHCKNKIRFFYSTPQQNRVSLRGSTNLYPILNLNAKQQPCLG